MRKLSRIGNRMQRICSETRLLENIAESIKNRGAKLHKAFAPRFLYLHINYGLIEIM